MLDENTNMQEQYAEEIFDPTFSIRVQQPNQEIDAEATENAMDTVYCQSPNHPERYTRKIREGVSAIAVLRRNDDISEIEDTVWTVVNICCDNCSEASTYYEQADKSNPIAVIEGEMQCGPDSLLLQPRILWDLHLA